MKRDLALVAFLAIFLILIANSLACSIPAAIGNEMQGASFLTAADGAESSQSLTVFSETLDEDALFYPDAFLNDTVVLASAGTGSPDDWGTNYTATHAKDADYFYAGDLSAPADVDMILNFTLPAGLAVEAAKINLYVTTCTVGILYAYDGSTWDSIGSLGTSLEWYNLTFYDADGISDVLFLNLTIDNEIGTGEIFLDYAEVSFYEMHLADSDHFGESFADISDWSTSDTSITTDDDVATITENGAGSTGRAYSSFSSTDYFEYYYEFRIESMTATTANLEFWDGAAYNTLKTFTAAGTYKGIISDADAATMQRIGFLVGSNGGNIKPDYLRIGPADEMGWQHDGSSTEGVTDGGGAEKTFTASSDGDILTLNITTGAGASGSSNYYINFDTTTTKADLERDYYPFVEMKARLIENTGAGAALIFASDGYYTYLDAVFLETSWTTYRINHKASTGSHATEACWFYWGAGVSSTIEIEIDYVKAYSIVNDTLTQSGVTSDDYLYVDSGVLYSTIDDGYIELNHDPALSVSDTYSVYNLTTSGTAPQFSQYVSSWSTYSDDTRGATTSGTVTDIKLKFNSTEVLSAIKFIEDGTAPDIIDKFIGPPEPDDSEAVTITAVTYDAVEVYEVTINAVVYPTGFSDVDYDATEQTTDVLWSYEFSTLTAGYYLFQITASDGANTYSEYMPVTVRVSAIEISTYTFFGASSDFDYMQYSGHISHDCTYNISEWSTTWAKNETHTGSVTEGMFNIAWDKIGVDDAEANFTIVFVSGTLSLTIEGFYGTAYKALQVTEIDFVNLEQSDSWTTNLTINFYTNKEVDWTVYDRDNDDAVLHSGTTTEGDGFITWVQNTARGAHQFAVKWTDSISDQWYNNSYWVFDRNIDDLPGGADPGADQRRTIEFWATVGAIAGILGIIVIGLSHYNLDEMIKNLPNYRTQG